MSTNTDTLTRLHDHYVEAVNFAVAEGDERRIRALAEEYDRELAELGRVAA
jgi:hypothetical protein